MNNTENLEFFSSIFNIIFNENLLKHTIERDPYVRVNKSIIFYGLP